MDIINCSFKSKEEEPDPLIEITIKKCNKHIPLSTPKKNIEKKSSRQKRIDQKKMGLRGLNKD